jgi:hypothetical protein
MATENKKWKGVDRGRWTRQLANACLKEKGAGLCTSVLTAFRLVISEIQGRAWSFLSMAPFRNKGGSSS